MFKIIFTPKAEHMAKILALPTEKKDHLCSILFDIVSQLFSPQPRGYESAFDARGIIGITVLGVSPFSNRSTQEYVQKVADGLLQSKLSELYEIHQVTRNVEPHDCLPAPEVIVRTHYPESLINAFDLTQRNVPEHFLCPITRSIMHNPAYLMTNPKINYEYSALMVWVVEHRTDPLTRQSILAPGIISNIDLRNKIYSFVMDMALGKRVEHYFESEKKDMAVQCSLSSNPAALFSGAEKSLPSALSLSQLFETVKLDKEFYCLASKALRRAVHENKEIEAKRLLTEFGSNNIINLQDENSASRKTALHIAISREHFQMIGLLLAHGAKTDIADACGETAVILANKSNNIEVQKLFGMASAAKCSS